MKFSADTIQILKNFATINPNLYFKEGSHLYTLSAARAVYAKAAVAETFPKNVAIYDLNSLLQLLTFSDDQEVEFEDKQMKIKNDVGIFDFFYCDPTLIKDPPTKEIDVETVLSFNLSGKDIQTIQKTVNLLAAPTISLIGKGGKVILKVGDRKNDLANSFNKIICETDREFECNIASENFKLIPDAYEVTISKKSFFYFKSQSRDLIYLIAMEPGSTI